MSLLKINNATYILFCSVIWILLSTSTSPNKASRMCVEKTTNREKSFLGGWKCNFEILIRLVSAVWLWADLGTIKREITTCYCQLGAVFSLTLWVFLFWLIHPPCIRCSSFCRNKQMQPLVTWFAILGFSTPSLECFPPVNFYLFNKHQRESFYILKYFIFIISKKRNIECVHLFDVITQSH